MSQDICYADATELAARIRSKAVSPVEVVSAHLERIADVNPRINAIVALVDGAMERAQQAELAVMRGESWGPLHEVPFTIKDCIDTEGTRTTRGSKLFEGYIPNADATVVTRLKQAGGILMAKTNLPEFALWWETDNLVFGRTVNPWNPERTSGGSSGGEAAALAAGLSPLGIGSDVGGSIRAPAHHCGVVGLKATHGRVPLTGHWPETLLRAMHVGPMARTVRDVALALSVVSGPDAADPYAVPVPLQSRSKRERLPSGLRVGWDSGRAFGPVEPEVKETVARAATALAEVGCDVEEVSLPGLEGTDTQALSLAVYSAEAGHYLQPIVSGREDELSPNIQRRLALPLPTFPEYLSAKEDWEKLRRDTADYFSRYDLLLCPCVPLPAHAHNVTELTIAGETVTARNSLGATIPWDLTGSPAISVPFGWSADGLPIGVQIVGRHFDEATVLEAAEALESAHDSANRRPPV
jgi:aspartyl-tRNA(Asn)/glutamyl-tRNA(Gln) amidotransferase subunit A